MKLSKQGGGERYSVLKLDALPGKILDTPTFLAMEGNGADLLDSSVLPSQHQQPCEVGLAKGV